jgi:hypothetical protein
VALAAQPGVSWTVSRTPRDVSFATSTSVVVTVTNTSASAQIGCISIVVPGPEFAVGATSIASQPTPSRIWAVSHAPGGGGTIVTAQATNGGSTIRGGSKRDTVAVAVTVSGRVAGSHGWTAAAFGDTACLPSKALDLTAAFSVTVQPAPTPRPTPTPPPAPKPTPAPLASPRLLATPMPSASPPASPAPTAAVPVSSTRPVSASPGPLPPPRPSASPSLAPAWVADDDPFVVPVTHSAPGPMQVATTGDIGALMLQWGVPAVSLSVPGLLIVVVVLAQSFGGVAWLPFVRRWIGGFGIRRRDRRRR